METFSALLAICEGNSPVTAEFPAQRPVTRSFDVFFDLRLNQRLSKHSWGWWYETPLRSLWRHCNVTRDIPLNWSVSQTTVGTSWIGIGSEAYLNNGFAPAIKRLQINVYDPISTKFCTFHDTSVVDVTCAKYGGDVVIICMRPITVTS